ATALLARTYLYLKDWTNAEIQATSVLGNSSFGLVDLDKVFLKNNKEAIWQLQPVGFKGLNTQEAIAFVVDPIYGFDTYNGVYLNPNLLNSFESGDQRKNYWISNITINGTLYWYPYKYKIVNRTQDANFPVTEYSTIFRLGEQYLIRAEARIQQNKIADGVDDLNALRERATDKNQGTIQLPKLSTTMNQMDALKAVEHERQVELFTEWGHRWLDLKRTDRIDQVMRTIVPTKIPGGTWKTNQQRYPLPLIDLQRNPNLIQNSGY
ncbi:RagB/SusD family nutrient uptake outer membrane protein, partial [Pedobacter sp. HMWF019]|uniref:RagB/SusD family nutrient uptake outer membrane protein n=1 Tax=Pedobacter sp. HMWF019 TaxID=2056856 RepID=UPI000D42E368